VLRWGDVSWLEGFGWAVERLKFGVVGAERKEKKALVGDGDVLDNVFREEREKKGKKVSFSICDCVLCRMMKGFAFLPWSRSNRLRVLSR
jgi:hypothetical protein